MASLDGKVYVAGGQIGVTMLSVLFAYDPATDTWTAKSPMPTARGGAAAVAANGLLYVIGGCTDAGCGGFVGTVEVYDPITDTWTPKASMPTPRRAFGVGVIGSVIYAVGGL
ncbi:MAG TPA: kelch repeat-containing protein [Candidatus Acidoferrales bacterium]|nr:kelch repeat-containing protein [Candidatus Acidoferrales bacterium]